MDQYLLELAVLERLIDDLIQKWETSDYDDREQIVELILLTHRSNVFVLDILDDFEKFVSPPEVEQLLQLAEIVLGVQEELQERLPQISLQH